MTEQDLMNHILVAISQRAQVLALRINSGAGRGFGGGVFKGAPAGTADILCCVAGRFVGLEVKTEDGRQTVQQRRFEEAVRRAGGVYAVVRSVADALGVVEEVERAAA